MNDFDYDILQKKLIARSAAHRKRGSKSKKCNFLSDQYTYKQWKNMNGEVMSYQLNRPVSWRGFKALPKDIQKEYLQNLISKYNVNATVLSAMFGVMPLTVRRHISINDLGISFHVGRSMSQNQKNVWEEFLSESNSCEGLLDEPVLPSIEKIQTDVVKNSKQVHCEDISLSAEKKMKMTNFSLVFEGNLNVRDIMSSLISILSEQSIGQLEITYTAQ